MEGSPAAKCGIRRGDVIVEIKGEKVLTSKDAQQLVDGSETDKEMQVKVRRGKESKVFIFNLVPGDLSQLNKL